MSCFASNAVYIVPLVTELELPEAIAPNVIVSCFASNAVLICAEVDGLLLLLLGALNVIVSCFVSNCVCIALVTPFKYPYSVLLIVPSCIKLAFNLADDEMVGCFASICVCKLPNVFVTFVAKLPELSRADANSLNVSKAPGAPFTKLDTAVETKAVVAICVVFVPLVAVGAIGVPVRDGEASVA